MYNVYLQNRFKKIGQKIDSSKGGIVVDEQDNVVGIIQCGIVHDEWVLTADKEWHTGKQWDGEVVVWSNRPSRI